ncbi:MAG TPA: hypothetical protein VLG67_01275 [Candidatus Saccharimonadales bacterium]|nr:hypothetical protein [Candidatus Saccharimonadales bacterium]
MIIEIGLIQNFLLAVIVVAAFSLAIILIRNLFKRKPADVPVDMHPIDGSNNRVHQHATDDQIKIDDKAYRNIIKTAQKHAKNILNHTTAAATEILANSKQTNENLEGELDKILQQIAARDIHELKNATGTHEAEYQKHLQSTQQDLLKATKDTIEATKKTYQEKLDQFTSELIKSGLSTQDLVDKKTKELLTVADQEIADYKKAQLGKVDDQIKKLLEKVYRDVLRIGIPENVHQDLIIKSLDEAKKDGLFKL